MKFSSRNFIFSLLIFLCGITANAQKVFIANDFGNCGVGLRDSSGKWLAEPIYQSIRDWPDGYYLVLLGSKEGVLDSTGKVIIPAIYDYLQMERVYRDSLSDHIFFYAKNDGKAGLLNLNHEVVIPLQYRYINVNYDGTIVAKRSKTRYSLFDIYGRETVIPDRQPEAPDPIGDHLLNVARNTCWPVFSQRYHQSKKYSWRGFYYPVITLKKKYGVMNDSLRLVIPKDFGDIYYKPGDYKLIAVTKRKKTGFYSITGEQVWAPVYSISYNFLRTYTAPYGSISTINKYGFTAAKYHKKWGIIAANGDTILPFIYSYISIAYSSYNSLSKKTGGWIVKYEDREGVFDPSEREWIMKPEYYSLYPVRSYLLAGDSVSREVNERNPYLYGYNESGFKIYVANKNGKYGMVTSNGQEILPFGYDHYSNTFSGYIFAKDSSYIMVRFPDYTRERDVYATHSVVKTAPTDGKFKKVISENGDILWINPDLLNDTAQLNLYTKPVKNREFNPQTYDHQLHATAVIISTLEHSAKFPNIPMAFTIHNPDINYSPSDSTFDFVIDVKSYYYARAISVVGKDDHHVYYGLASARGILRDDGFQLLRPGSYYYCNQYSTQNGKAVFSVNNGRNKSGLIDGDGKLLIDTTWASIGTSRGNYFWVRKKDPRLWAYSRDNWNILDTSTGALLLGKKMLSERVNRFGTEAVVLEYKSGQKLYNYHTRRFVLSGNVNDIFLLDSIGKYFAVRTCYGHIGIIDGNGNWLADTIWTALIDANNLKEEENWRTGYYRYYSDQAKTDYTYCVLSNDTGWAIYDGITGTVSKDPALKKRLLDISLRSVHIDSTGEATKFCSDCPSWVYRDSLAEKPLIAWQEKMLFDSLFMGEHFIADSNFFWYASSCKDCMKRNKHGYFEYAWAKNYDREALLHYVDFNNDSCFSVSRNNLTSYLYNRAYPKDLFFTAVMYADGPHPFQLDSLFTGTSWKKLISDEVSLYFESHPNIEGSCHNPYMLPLVMKDRFVITEKGIELFPPGFSENEKQLFVPIPWIKLKPYMRKDVIRKLGI